ncbi:hypothetical protein HY086_01430 [Candidatus Gottesmanbacteria bacterium]|nr:hypothetical protein [Candidatus Gottesmanbacteria bacterium]
MATLEQQISMVEALLKTGAIDPRGEPLFKILAQRPWERDSRPPPLPVPDRPQSAGDAAVRFNYLQAWIKAGFDYKSFIDAFGPWPEE